MAQKLGTLWATHPGLSTISIAGDEKYRMKESMVPFLNELAKNDALTDLNVSSNGLGDAGFAALATAMRTNTKLRFLKSDGNKVSFSGFQALRSALLYNQGHALESWEWPVSDAKSASPNLLAVLNDISAIVHRKGTALSSTSKPQNPLVFVRDWPTPGKPSSLPDVPQYLKEHASSVEAIQAAAVSSTSDGSASPRVSPASSSDASGRAPSDAPPVPPATLRPSRYADDDTADTVTRGRRRSHSTAFEKPPPSPSEAPAPPPKATYASSPRAPPVAEGVGAPSGPPPPTNRPPPPNGPPPPTNKPPPMSSAPPPPPPPASSAPPPPPPPSSAPAPPPPPAAPPAPKAPKAPSSNSAPPPPPPPSEDRSGLLSSISGFKGGLRKVQTNDRSTPKFN
jgi:hypothetical protein